MNRSNKSFLSVNRIFKIQTTLQYSLWEETVVPGENPQLSSQRWLTLFNTIRLDLSCFLSWQENHKWLSLKPLWQITKRHDAFRKTFFGITRKLFQTSKPHEELITFSRKNSYFFSRRNTNFEILSFRAIYVSDGVFNLTMLKWLDITNFIFSNKKIYREKAKQSMVRHFWRSQYEHRTKWNAFFIKINVLDISLGLKLYKN